MEPKVFGGEDELKNLIELLRKAILIYPSVFIITLLVVGQTINNVQEKAIDIDETRIPLGAPEPTPILYKQASNDSASVTLVYEKGTNQYLLFSGFKCLGKVRLSQNESIDTLSVEDLLQRVTKLE